MVKEGDTVTFSDESSVEHQALVTNVFGAYGPETQPSINVVYVSKDSNMTDNYGRQLVRKSSCPHRSNQSTTGYRWF